MVHQYISKENQTLLWKTIQRSPQFANQSIRLNREKWFSNIIKYFYETITSPIMSIAELKALNQQTIAYMINNLKHIENSRNYPIDSIQSQTHPPAPVVSTTYETPQTRMSTYTEQFNARQQEYSNMVTPPTPPVANFSEKIEDEAITNMDELLQQQIKQREYDIALVKPLPPINDYVNQTSEPIQLTHRNDEVMNAIMELTKQLAELRADIDLLKQNKEITTSVKSEKDIELHGVQ